MRVLLADDHPPLLEAVAEYLRRGGHDVVGEAHDSETAVELARQLQPDVVVLDARMPPRGGVDAARRIRDAHPACTVVLHTAFTDPALTEELAGLGVLTVEKAQRAGPLLSLLASLPPSGSGEANG